MIYYDEDANFFICDNINVIIKRDMFHEIESLSELFVAYAKLLHKYFIIQNEYSIAEVFMQDLSCIKYYFNRMFIILVLI